MGEDYYKILGVSRQATQEEIEKAHRSQARKYHPDLNPDDAKAKEKFQKVQKAFDVLKDPKTRQMYDRFGEKYDAFQGGGGGGGAGPQGFDEVDLSQLFGQGGGGGGFEDILRQFAGGGFGGGAAGAGGGGRGPRTTRGRRPARGHDLEHEITIPFQLGVTGGDFRIAAPRPEGDSEAITVKIPPGIVDGKKLRLTGKGASGAGGAGDLYLKIRIAPHPFFKRTGDNLEVQLPISVTQAFLGDKIDVPTPYGDLKVTIAPGTSSGKRLRIRGYGVSRADGVKGDLFVEVQIRAPKTLNEQAKKLLVELQEACPIDPVKISW